MRMLVVLDEWRTEAPFSRQSINHFWLITVNSCPNGSAPGGVSVFPDQPAKSASAVPRFAAAPWRGSHSARRRSGQLPADRWCGWFPPVPSRQRSWPGLRSTAHNCRPPRGQQDRVHCAQNSGWPGGCCWRYADFRFLPGRIIAEFLLWSLTHGGYVSVAYANRVLEHCTRFRLTTAYLVHRREANLV